MGDRLFALVHRSRLEVVGLVVFAVGATLDLVYHLVPPDGQAAVDRFLGADGANAHLVTLVGMVLIALALLDAARRARGKEVSGEPNRRDGSADPARASQSRRPSRSIQSD